MYSKTARKLERMHMPHISGFQQCPPGKKVTKATSLLGKYKVKSMLWTSFHDKWNKKLGLINEAGKANRTKQVFFLYLRFSVIKPENTFFSAWAALPGDFSYSPRSALSWLTANQQKQSSWPAQLGLPSSGKERSWHCSQVRAQLLALSDCICKTPHRHELIKAYDTPVS